MTGFSIKNAADACGGRLIGCRDDGAELGRIIIDSRDARPGDLFAAFRGEKVDGHEYIAAALSAGALCCLAERVPEGAEGPIILVGDVQSALEDIAAAYRSRLSLPMIGVTGSVGKTSAKEMISSVLSTRLDVLKTEKNLNNQIGVPMTLSRIEPHHGAAVVEMGISGFGEMSRLARMVKPDIAVFTLIGHAHLEFLHDLDGVLRAKTEMLDYMSEDACVIMNGDDPLLASFECRRKKLLFGTSANCDIRAENIVYDTDKRTECDIVYGRRRVRVQIPAFGRHMVSAALEGAAVGFVMGLDDEEIARGVSMYRTVGRRAALTRTGTLTLIDDCYNSNPDSLKCGIDSLSELPGRHVCILGDMLELGGSADRLHFEAGRYAAEKGVDAVFTCGPIAEHISEGAGERARHFSDRKELLAELPGLIRKGDCVLVKASRGMRFDEISEALKEL